MDVECSWKKRKPSNLSTQSASEMFPPSKKYAPLSRKPDEEDRKFLYSKLEEYGRFTGIWWIMSPEPPVSKPLPISTIGEIVFSEQFLKIEGQDNQNMFLQNKAKISTLDIVNVASLTTGQRDNPLWHEARKGRLRASNFGCVLKSKRATPSLIKRLLGEYDLSRVKAVQWGTNNEKEALKFWHVLEVKCPYTVRNDHQGCCEK